MAFIKVFLSLSLALLLVACSTDPATSFYLLKAVEPSDIKQKSPQLKRITVLVNPIKFPEYLDRPQMVIRDSAYKFQLNEHHRWAEPLKNEFTRVFIQNLNSRIMPNQALVYSEPHGTHPNINLSIEVLRLDINTDNQAVLSIKWAYWVGQETTYIKWLKYEDYVPVKIKSYESRVEAQSEAIALFTDYVVATIPQFIMTR